MEKPIAKCPRKGKFMYREGNSVRRESKYIKGNGGANEIQFMVPNTTHRVIRVVKRQNTLSTEYVCKNHIKK